MRAFKRALTLVATTALALGGALTAIAVTASTAEAAVVRPFTLNFSKTVFGDVLHVGNGNSACPTATSPTDPFGAPKAECATAQDRTNTSPTGINDSFFMTWADVDSSAATYNSSRATVTIPTGATVEFARLSWSGDTGTIRLADGTVSALPGCNTRQFLAGAGTAVLPAGTPESTSVRVTVGANPTVTHAPQVISRDALANVPASQPQFYAAYANITSTLAAAPTGVPVDVTVGNIWSPQGFGCYSGWSLSVVYSYPTANVNAPSSRHVAIYDGHVRQSSIDAATTLTASGFTANATGARVAVTAFEGDFNIAGDRFAINGTNQSEPATGATDNFFISATDGSSAPSVANNMSVDAKSLPAPVAVGATSLPLTFSTSGDTFLATTVAVSVPVDTPPLPAVTATLSATPSTVSTANTAVAIAVRVTNSGNTPLTQIGAHLTTFGGSGPVPTLTCPTGSMLQPGDVAHCSGSYTVTQADVDAGGFSLAARASAIGPSVVEVSATTSTVPVTAPPSVALFVANGVSPGSAGAGETVTFAWDILSTSNVTLTGVGFEPNSFTGSGPLPSVLCPQTSLAPQQGTTCTTQYVLTQDDVESGGVHLQARVRVVPPDGQAVWRVTPTTTVTAGRSPALTVALSTVPAFVSAASEPVAVEILLTNTGNVRVLAIDFATTGLPGPVSCPVAALEPNTSTTCTATLTLDQAEFDAGGRTITAQANGVTSYDASVVGGPTALNVAAVAAPAVTVDLSVDPASVAAAEQEVSYSALVTNTGNVTLSGLALVDDTFTGSGTPGALSCPVTSLAPTVQTTCTATYALMQADVDAGGVSRTVTASGAAPGGATTTSAPDTAVVTSPASAALAVETTATPATATSAGQVVDYSFLVTNTGNVTVNSVGITPAAFSGAEGAPMVTCPAAALSLAPGDDVTCTASHTLSQADVNDGGTSLTVLASGTAPGGAAVTSPEDVVLVTVAAAPALGLQVLTDPTTATAAGTEIGYSFVLTNTGNVSLTAADVTVADFTGSAGAPVVTCPAGVALLEPGDDVTCTASSTLTQADVNAGGTSLTARAHGTPPVGEPVDSSDAVGVVTVARSGAITATTAPVTADAAGDVVDLDVVVTNAGNVTLTGVGITSGTFTGSGALPELTCPAGAGTFEPGDEITCTAPYTLTQEDVDAGGVSLEATATATATGTDPAQEAVSSDPVTVQVTVIAAPQLTVALTATPSEAESFEVDQEVVYDAVVTNAGNVTLTAVELAQGTFTGSGNAPEITCPTDVTLAPGDDVTCTARYTITQADVDRRSVLNEVTASAQPPRGERVASPPAVLTLTSTSLPALVVATTADRSTFDEAGQAITYSFTVTNAGNVTLTGVALMGTEFSGSGDAPEITCPDGVGVVGDLAPAAEVTCTATYVVTQADVDSGGLTHAAVATATPPEGWLEVLRRLVAGDITSEASTLEITSTRAPALTLTGSADRKVTTAVGQEVVYSFVVTNTGNVTLTHVGATVANRTGDGAVSSPVCGAGSLTPGDEVTCTVVTTVTEADAAAGALTLAAFASGTAPDGEKGAVTTGAVEVRVAVEVQAGTHTPTKPGETPSESTSSKPGATGGPAVLTDTGADIRLSGGVAALALLLGAGALVLVRRRNRANLTD